MSVNVSDLQTSLNNITTLITSYVAVLTSDAVNPQPTHTNPDGSKVDRNEWREGIVEMIRQLTKEAEMLNELINALDPSFPIYQVVTTGY